MGRHGSDSTMVSSSIALLQERFRQLQKVKERREEKELLKLFSESERVASTARLEPGKSEIIRPCRQPLHQDFLSLGLNSNSKIKSADPRAKKTTPWSSSLWPGDSNFVSTSNSFDPPEVDTSLHL